MGRRELIPVLRNVRRSYSTLSSGDRHGTRKVTSAEVPFFSNHRRAGCTINPAMMPQQQPSPVTIRRATPEDAAAAGQTCYDAFATISRQHNFPSDVPKPE